MVHRPALTRSPDPQTDHQHEWPKKRVQNIQAGVGPSPAVMVNPIQDFFHQRCDANDRKRDRRRQRSTGDQSRHQQNKHSAVHVEQGVGDTRAVANPVNKVRVGLSDIHKASNPDDKSLQGRTPLTRPELARKGVPRAFWSDS